MNLDTKTKVNKMETEPVLRLILKMAVSPLLSMLMQFSYGLVDCMFVSGIAKKLFDFSEQLVRCSFEI